MGRPYWFGDADRVVCTSGTGEPVGCVGSGWTGDMECDNFRGLLPYPGPGPVN